MRRKWKWDKDLTRNLRRLRYHRWLRLDEQLFGWLRDFPEHTIEEWPGWDDNGGTHRNRAVISGQSVPFACQRGMCPDCPYIYEPDDYGECLMDDYEHARGPGERKRVYAEALKRLQYIRRYGRKE